jgi:hypothetical protein
MTTMKKHAQGFRSMCRGNLSADQCKDLSHLPTSLCSMYASKCATTSALMEFPSKEYICASLHAQLKDVDGAGGLSPRLPGSAGGKPCKLAISLGDRNLQQEAEAGVKRC